MKILTGENDLGKSIVNKQFMVLYSIRRFVFHMSKKKTLYFQHTCAYLEVHIVLFFEM